MIKITHNLDKLQKRLSAMEKQIPFAAAKTLTTIGRRVKDELGSEVQSVFDKPTKYISSSPFSTVATKTKPETTVGIRDQAARGASPAQYVKEEFGGGLRSQKPFEVVLTRMGVLPAGWKAIPAAGMKLDFNGNPNRSQLKEIFGTLRSRMSIVSGRGKQHTLVKYFVVPVGIQAQRNTHLKPGIWRSSSRAGVRALIPVLIFIDGANYKKTIALREIAQRVIERDFQTLLAKELNKAIVTSN